MLHEQFRKPSKILGSRNGHPPIWKGSIPYHTLHKNDIWWYMANLEKLMIYLTPERRLCFLFDQASSLQDSELSEEVLLEEVLCKSIFPHGQHGQPVGQPPLHSHSIASSPSSPGVQTRMPEPLPERMSDRMPVYLSIYLIYLSVYLAGWLAGWLAG